MLHRFAPIVRSTAVALVVLCASFVPSVRAQDWPSGEDHWNLGAIGAKALTGVASRPQADASGKVSVSGDVPFLDGGPAELVLAEVAADGPAAAAGLAPGDVLVAAGGKKFKEDESLAALAKAIAKARADDGELELTVEKKGGDKEKVVVKLDVLGREGKDPVSTEARSLAYERAAAWLAEAQQDDGGLAAGLSGENGRVVATSLAGLAWIAGGSDLESGPYKEQVADAFTYVNGRMGALGANPLPKPDPGQPNWDQSNWAVVYAGIFLGELQAHTPNDAAKDTLGWIAKTLAERQERSGGYAHGPGGKNALDYVELNIVGSIALMAYGACHRAGVEVDEDAVDRLVEYLDASSSGGGVGYSTGAGQQGIGNIGRTVPAWRGMVLMERGRDGFAKQMQGYARKESQNFLGGHASLMHHIFFGGLGAHALSSKDGSKWWDAMEREVVLAQDHRGAFHSRPFQETANLGSNSDATMGLPWTTASWAILLVLDRKDAGLPLLVGAD
ncbi:MAG: DUF6288 domain-containing protein [Planctomycetota bacterium]